MTRSFRNQCRFCKEEIEISDKEQEYVFHPYSVQTGDRHYCRPKKENNFTSFIRSCIRCKEAIEMKFVNNHWLPFNYNDSRHFCDQK